VNESASTVITSPGGLRSLAQSLLEDEPGVGAFGDYELEEEIARGGMGIVYRAWQVSLARPVAVKVMREGAFADGKEAQRFRQEAEAAAALRHPGIVPVYESGEHGGRLFYAMEWIAGPNLAEVTRAQPAAAKKAAQWVREVAEAIAHAHAAGVIHRDLKPANVLLDPEGRTRVTDFGMAQRADTAGGLTLSGQMLGTPGYMAPEVAAGKARTAGAAADIYGLGALLFHLLTGRAPFIGESQASILRQVADAEPVSPRLLNASVPRDLETICLKALQSEPARRYATALAMAEDLARFLQGEPIQARPVSVTGRAVKWCRRKPALAASLGAIALLLTGVAAISVWSALRLEKSRMAEAEGRREARLNLYAADVRMAGQLYQKGSLESARRLLEGHVPGRDAEDFRGFDWNLLSSLLEGGQKRQAMLPAAPLGDDMPVSPDGKWALLKRESRAMLVELKTQRTVAEWEEQRTPGFYLRRVLWSEPAERVVVNGGDRVRLIAPATGGVEFLGEGGAETMALSPDGTALALGPARRGFTDPAALIEVWDVPARRLRHQLPLTAYARALTWSPDGAEIIAGVYPRWIEWWKPDATEPSRRLELPAEGAAANMPWAWFSPNASQVAVPWWDSAGDIPVYELPGGRVAHRLSGLSVGAARLAWSADGRWLAGSGSEQALVLHRAGVWQPHLLRGPRGLTGGLAFSAADELVSVSADRTARWWQVPPPEEALLFPNDMSGAHVWRPVWSPDGALVTLASHFGINGENKTMRGVLWDCARHAARFTWDEIGVWFSPDSRRLLTVERNAVYRLRDTASGAELERFTLEREGGFRLPRVSPDGRWMVVWHEPGAALLYDLPARKSVAALDGGTEAAFSPDSRRLARESGLRLALRDLATGAEQTTGVPCHHAIAWSPDGGTLASRFDAEVHLVAAQSGERKATLAGAAARVGVMLFLPDRRTLLTTAEDGSLCFWNLATERETLLLTTPNPCVYYCAASPDGRTVLAGGPRGYGFFRAVSLPPP